MAKVIADNAGQYGMNQGDMVKGYKPMGSIKGLETSQPPVEKKSPDTVPSAVSNSGDIRKG